MTALLAVYAVEFVALIVLLSHLVRQKRRYGALCTICVAALCMLAGAFFSAQAPRLFRSELLSERFFLLSFALAAVAIDVLLYMGLCHVLKRLSLETQAMRVTYVFLRCFIALDALYLLTNPLHLLAVTCTVGQAGAVVQSTYWLQVHQYIVLLQVLTMAVALLYKGLTTPFLYSGKYFFFGVYMFALYGLAMAIYCVPRLGQLRLLVIALLALLPFFLYFFIFFNRPLFMLAYIRQMIIDKLGSPVVLFDIDDMLVDYNRDAKLLFALDKQLVNRLSLANFLQRSVGNQMRERSTSTVEEVAISDAAGTKQLFKLDYTKLADRAGKNLGTLLLFHNITELKTLYNTMEKTATTDMLTGLSSKALLEKKVTEINLYRKFPYCAVVCNINGLRLISEGFGETAAQAATMHVADLLRAKLRASDFAAYADGNMIVLMSDTLEAEANKVFARISSVLNDDKTFSFRLSFEYGVAERLTRDSDMQLTIAQAQAAMLKKKMLSHSYTQQSIVESLQRTLRESSFETERHSLRVQRLCVKIADKLKLPQSQYEELKLLALFHDIGKLSIPRELLSKPSKLSEEERQIMMTHTINGSKVAMASKELAPIARGILCHHENWDGTGYPNGYAGEEIPFHARIVNLADAYDVMTHDRPWMQAMQRADAVAVIKEQSGKQFDPAIVSAFLQLSPEELSQE